MTVESPNCLRCKHYHYDDLTKMACDAFNRGIPDTIINGEILHNKSIPGDNGIVFERR